MKELEPCRAPGRSGRNLRRSGELSYRELQKGFGVLPEPTLSLVFHVLTDGHRGWTLVKELQDWISRT